MQTRKGFPNVLGSSLRAFFKRVLPIFEAAAPASPMLVATPSVPTQVVNASETIEAPKAFPRFRRTKEEIRLGLSIEQALGARVKLQQAVKPRKTKDVKAAKPVENTKRFRRTQQEIELGLSIEQAAAMRGVQLAGKPKKIFVERKVEVKPQSSGDLIETL